MNMYDSIMAINKKHKVRVKKEGTKTLDKIKIEPSGVALIRKELISGKKSKKHLMTLDMCKSSIDVAIAYMLSKDMLTKHPINPNHPRQGMEYKLC